jgi:hypothetical protein
MWAGVIVSAPVSKSSSRECKDRTETSRAFAKPLQQEREGHMCNLVAQ